MVTSISSLPSPPPSPGRRLAAAERLSLIEESAARLFAERGYGAATMDEIAAAAGVSKPMLYRHFESKKELYMRLIERRRDELAAAALDPLLGGEGELDARIEAMIDAWFAHVEEHPHSTRMLFLDTAADPEIEALHRELHRRQRAADVALLREYAPGIPEAELEPLGEVIRSSLRGLALWWLANPGVPRALPADAMMRTLRGLLPAGGGAGSDRA